MTTSTLLDFSELRRIDWSFEKDDTSYLTHNIHRYSGKYIPQIARTLIEKLTNPGDIIVDPFVGSGTTLLEAMILNRRSVGIDLNPLACLIAKAKTTIIAEEELRTNLTQHLDLVHTCVSHANGQLSFSSKRSPLREYFDTPVFHKWFQHSVLVELQAIKSSILEIRCPHIRNICEVAFSDILRERSNANGRYPNVMFDKRAPHKEGAIKQYRRRLASVVDSIVALTRLRDNFPHVPLVLQGDATQLPIVSHSADAIITHPPYIGSIPYAEYQFLSLMWRGVDSKQLDSRLTGGRRQNKNVVERFLAQVAVAIEEIRRILKPNHCAAVVIGNPTVRGQTIHLNRILRDLFVDLGFRLIGEIEREKFNMRASKMPTEYVQLFESPS